VIRQCDLAKHFIIMKYTVLDKYVLQVFPVRVELIIETIHLELYRIVRELRFMLIIYNND
jgi:hypothetical protein